MNADLRHFILSRDRRCVAAIRDPKHVCRDRWGRPHAPDALDLLTIEHVKDAPRMGKRAPDDPAHLVALCWAANVGVPSKEMRQWFREYLAKMVRKYPYPR